MEYSSMGGLSWGGVGVVDLGGRGQPIAGQGQRWEVRERGSGGWGGVWEAWVWLD